MVGREHEKLNICNIISPIQIFSVSFFFFVRSKLSMKRKHIH